MAQQEKYREYSRSAGWFEFRSDDKTRYGGKCCSMCRRKLRDGDVVLTMGEGATPKRFHRLCIRMFVESSYGAHPLTGSERVEAELGRVDTSGAHAFEAYRQELMERFLVD